MYYKCAVTRWPWSLCMYINMKQRSTYCFKYMCIFEFIHTHTHTHTHIYIYIYNCIQGKLFSWKILKILFFLQMVEEKCSSVTQHCFRNWYNQAGTVPVAWQRGASMQPLLRLKFNNCYILWVCVWSIMYPACTADRPCCHLWTVRLWNIFPHYLTNGTNWKEI